MKELLHKIKAFLVLFLIIFPFYYIFANIGNYFDPLHFCYINIQSDLLKGNTKTIHGAIVLLRKESPEQYATLCKYVDRIRESYCMASDWNLDQTFRGLEAPGCYIKGSKVLYLKAQSEETEKITRERLEVIAKYANYSKAFWESNMIQ